MGAQCLALTRTQKMLLSKPFRLLRHDPSVTEMNKTRDKIEEMARPHRSYGHTCTSDKSIYL